MVLRQCDFIFRWRLMHVPKSRQGSLFDVGMWLGDAKQRRLEGSWAEGFRRDIYPLLMAMEPRFAPYYSPDHGAPNKPVATLLGLLILKEANDLSDREVVERFEYDVQWQYALETPTAEAHVARKTLHNFRRLLVRDAKVRPLFTALTDEIARRWKIRTTRHRIDSTQILSNMKLLTRLGLFVKTIERFLARLRRLDPTAVERLPKRFREDYLERQGYFADAKSSAAPHRLEQCARDVWYLIDRFRGEETVTALRAYQLLVRLFAEQCEVAGDQRDPDGVPPVRVTVAREALAEENEVLAEEDEPPAEEADGVAAVECAGTEGVVTAPAAAAASGDVPVVIALKREVASDSLQSPSDPDATYSGHKGKGYQAQLAETCHPDNPFQLLTVVEVEGAHESDMNAPGRIHQDLIDRGHTPKESFVDSAYVSGDNLLDAERNGIALIGPMSGKAPSGDKLSLAEFQFNDDRSAVLTCPGGHAPLRHEPSKTEGAVNAQFDRTHCDACPLAARCPSKPTRATRFLTFTARDIAIAQRRRNQETNAFKEAYKIRSGIEATHSGLKRRRGMGHLRVRGSPAVTVAVTFKALAENCFRVVRHTLDQVHHTLQPALRAAL